MQLSQKASIALRVLSKMRPFCEEWPNAIYVQHSIEFVLDRPIFAITYTHNENKEKIEVSRVEWKIEVWFRLLCGDQNNSMKKIAFFKKKAHAVRCLLFKNSDKSKIWAYLAESFLLKLAKYNIFPNSIVIVKQS